MEENEKSKLRNSVYIFSSHSLDGYEKIYGLFDELFFSGYYYFYFANDAAALIPFAIDFSKRHNIKIYVTHNHCDHYYFYSEVTHLFFAR